MATPCLRNTYQPASLMNFQMEAARINANQIHIYRDHQKVLMVVARC